MFCYRRGSFYQGNSVQVHCCHLDKIYLSIQIQQCQSRRTSHGQYRGKEFYTPSFDSHRSEKKTFFKLIPPRGRKRIRICCFSFEGDFICKRFLSMYNVGTYVECQYQEILRKRMFAYFCLYVGTIFHKHEGRRSEISQLPK